jgi:diaminopimelate epimerase
MAHRLGLANTEITLGSPAGLIHARLKSNSIVCVAMGIPNFEPACVPFLAEHAANSYTLTCVGTEIEFGAVSIGNPHAVIRVDAVASAPVDTIGHAVENHPLFPRRTNVEFMEIVSPNHIKLRVYERGVGETLACGTGACGAVAVGQRRGWLEKDVMVDLPGGRLNVEWLGPDQPIWLTGPTAIVYTGYVDL